MCADVAVQNERDRISVQRRSSLDDDVVGQMSSLSVSTLHSAELLSRQVQSLDDTTRNRGEFFKGRENSAMALGMVLVLEPPLGEETNEAQMIAVTSQYCHRRLRALSIIGSGL